MKNAMRQTMELVRMADQEIPQLLAKKLARMTLADVQKVFRKIEWNALINDIVDAAEELKRTPSRRRLLKRLEDEQERRGIR